MSLPLPPSLLTRLRSDELSLSSSLSSNSLPDSISSAKTLATRKLLLLTPLALDTTESVMRSSSPKDQLAAASLILSKSPATSQDLSSSDRSLPAELLATLSSALSSLSNAFSNLTSQREPSPSSSSSSSSPSSSSPSAPSANPAQDVSITILKEPVMESSPLPIANLPEPDPSLELSSSGLTKKKKKAPAKQAEGNAKKKAESKKKKAKPAARYALPKNFKRGAKK